MKTKLFLLITTLLTLPTIAQITFEKGYYINNSNQKIECLIKNIDWENNPTSFEYVLTENSEPTEATIATVKEFGIYNNSRYICESVNIDRSSDDIAIMSSDKNPEFKMEKLFLKVLVEGKSNLYEYVDGNLRRYFYDTKDTGIEQLIFKRYKTPTFDVGVNNKFRQQLWIDLKCESFQIKKMETINYRKNDLIKFFIEYSNCSNQKPINFENTVKKDLFNLTLRPRITNASLSIQNFGSSFQNTNFGSKTGVGFGVEAEIILPFNKNKWSFVIEPTYQSYKNTKTKLATNVSGGQLISKATYSSVELPVSLRHYLFLSNQSSFFITASYVLDFSSNSSIEFKRVDNSIINTLEVETRNNFALGLGYKTKEKYSVELKYQLSREILGSYSYWSSDYKSVSLIFGYTLF